MTKEKKEKIKNRLIKCVWIAGLAFLAVLAIGAFVFMVLSICDKFNFLTESVTVLVSSISSLLTLLALLSTVKCNNELIALQKAELESKGKSAINLIRNSLKLKSIEINKSLVPKKPTYTTIDEATRERFIYAYSEHSGWPTKDFIQRAVLYFVYAPAVIQTDNGTEFTNPKGTGEGQVHIADVTMKRFGIRHQLIRSYTLRRNGKVERSHRTDQERFYNFLQYSTFEELQEKMGEWLIRYNKAPSTSEQSFCRF